MKKNLTKVSYLTALLLLAGANVTVMNAGNSKDNKDTKDLVINGKEGGKFYNNDGLSHTYRIAVTPDNRAFI